MSYSCADSLWARSGWNRFGPSSVLILLARCQHVTWQTTVFTVNARIRRRDEGNLYIWKKLSKEWNNFVHQHFARRTARIVQLTKYPCVWQATRALTTSRVRDFSLCITWSCSQGGKESKKWSWSFTSVNNQSKEWCLHSHSDKQSDYGLLEGVIMQYGRCVPLHQTNLQPEFAWEIRTVRSSETMLCVKLQGGSNMTGTDFSF